MKKFFAVFTLLCATVLLISCGESSSSSKNATDNNSEESAGAKQGDLYGRCYPNKTCNENYTCDEDHNICVKIWCRSNDDCLDPAYPICNSGNGLCESQDGKPAEDNSGSNNGSCKKVDGNTWSSLASNTMTWQKAVDYCQDLRECGYSDWHLPDINELRTLIKNCPGAETGGACPIKSPNCLDWDCLMEEDKDYNYVCQCPWRKGGYYSKLGDDEHINLWSSSNMLVWDYDSDTMDRDTYAWFVPFGGDCDEYCYDELEEQGADEDEMDMYWWPNKDNKKHVRCVR